jgi:hypothetical protein
MGKVLGILAIVAAIWVSAEVYTKGTAGAFGGLLVRAGAVDGGSEAAADPGHRAGARVSEAHAEADARRSRLLAE